MTSMFLPFFELCYNLAVFQGLCSALYSLDQGLVCSSSCNMETMKEAAFHCYYILQPSDTGPMLLRVTLLPVFFFFLLDNRSYCLKSCYNISSLCLCLHAWHILLMYISVSVVSIFTNHYKICSVLRDQRKSLVFLTLINVFILR